MKARMAIFGLGARRILARQSRQRAGLQLTSDTLGDANDLPAIRTIWRPDQVRVTTTLPI
jgi:hypothetical protein